MKCLIKPLAMAALVGITVACDTKPEGLIEKSNMKIVDGKLTPEALWAFGRISDIQVSPDGETMTYGVNYYSVPQNKGNRELFVANVDGSNVKQITETVVNERAAKWFGDKIAFLSNESGSSQVWLMKANGDDRVRVTDYKAPITDFRFSPDGTQILFVSDVKYGERTVDIYPDLDKATGWVEDDLMYKHWDEWTTSVPHPFLASFDGQKMGDAVDLLEGEPFESPMKPFGGIEQFDFSPDGKTIAYTCRKKTGKAYAISTNSDIYLYDIATKAVKNMTEGMMGYDVNPLYSPNGEWIAWQSMERDGYEADKNRLFVMNVLSGEKREVSANFDQNSESLLWSADSKSIFLTSVWHGKTQIYQADVATGAFRQVTDGQHDYESIAWAGDKLVALRHSLSMPNEIYAVNVSNGDQKQISFENKKLLDQITMGKVEERWVKTTDNQQMLVWVVYPPNFDPNQKYPALLYCQGGPQSAVSQFWSYRWNLQLMAANGYIVVAPNRRGLPGFGQKWCEQISGDYGGQNMNDYFSAIDNVASEPFVDKDRLGCVGASYGGFSVYWMAGNHNKRFKAFIAHNGMFNLEQQYLETEELFFANWDLGGPYWDKNNPVAQRTYANSPHKFVDKWDTPILVIHSEKDYRILASQGMSAFNAAQIRGIPSQMLMFPDENHWVLQPQNSILWQRTFFNWLDKWLKPNLQ